MSKLLVPCCVLSVLLAGLAGCVAKKPAPTPVEAALDESKFPAHVSGTIAQYAMMVGGGELALRGHGIVVGLGRNGSRECPPALRGYLTQYMLKQRVFPAGGNPNSLRPSDLLDDLDTAVVEVWGRVPPGAPAGTMFDVHVKALPQTQTISLDGGYLLPAEMRLSVEGMSGAQRESQVLATAGGPVFVNPFVDPADSAQSPKLREGRILGGGRLLDDRAVRLQLHVPDYARCDAIRRRINEVFPASRPAAVAKNPSTIDLTIPRKYRPDYGRFLALVMHLPVQGGGGAWEAKARQIVQDMQVPGAPHDELALIWEAIGRTILPTLKPLYDSQDLNLSYYSARTGLRLGDPQAIGTVSAVARNAEAGPLQLQAVQELGRCKLHTCLQTLYELLDDPNDMVRVAAVDALVEHGDSSRVTHLKVGEAFVVDLADSSSRYMIYASQSGRPRLMVFGRQLQCLRPMFFQSPGEMVVINAADDQCPLSVFRKVPPDGLPSSTFKVDPQVSSLVRTMGTPVEYVGRNKVRGMGLTYGQVVTVLANLCQKGHIQAKFVLQPPGEMQRIYMDDTTVGRPDAPEM